MSYSRTNWINGDLITAEKLNNIEDKLEETPDILCIILHYNGLNSYTASKTFQEITDYYGVGSRGLCILGIEDMYSANFGVPLYLGHVHVSTTYISIYIEEFNYDDFDGVYTNGRLEHYAITIKSTNEVIYDHKTTVFGDKNTIVNKFNSIENELGEITNIPLINLTIQHGQETTYVADKTAQEIYNCFKDVNTSYRVGACLLGVGDASTGHTAPPNRIFMCTAMVSSTALSLRGQKITLDPSYNFLITVVGAGIDDTTNTVSYSEESKTFSS